MRRVDVGRRQHDFSVTRDIQNPVRCGRVRDDHPAHLDVVLRSDRDLRARFDPVIATAEHRAPFGEQDLRLVRMLQRRLEGV